MLSGNPVETATLIVCIVVGAVAGYSMLSDDWSIARRVLGGGIGGAGGWLVVMCGRIL